MCSDLGTGSRICAFYSFTGILFTLWVGVLITTQSFFISGLDDPELAQRSAFGAMALFIVTFFASIFGIYYDSGRKSDSIEETPEGYQLNTGVPTEYGTSRYD
mmetsp:Transcript_50/g.101  ORF Transcript_50/g.101 Transcript_50/m.101 type:complete len:103 (+) Transcript_50:67-375(+)|eukprot:CAMPEP_0178505060 /NCGR_PEP_ID=MMETSP0696-20121128/18928_1 /TAXON_ID=265572 /ORGANISM="Extubocellulus spinifer, Strain CCMP396" /LENGTH=102 /DNA_ID=CAMNT_0020134343 /DNA_START=52 /DNA_END=360 /DNA_ORIENTATION=+